MPHLPDRDPIHRYAGDPTTILIPVDDLPAADANEANWRAQGAQTLAFTLADSELSVLSGADAKTKYPDADLSIGDNEAVLEVILSSSQTGGIGVGRWRWQAAAGEMAPPPVAGRGELVMSRRIPQ